MKGWPPRMRNGTVWICELICQDGRIIPASGAQARLSRRRAREDVQAAQKGTKMLKYGVGRYLRVSLGKNDGS